MKLQEERESKKRRGKKGERSEGFKGKEAG